MGAKVARRRTKTAREVAEKFGMSERHLRRFVAEPRAEFELRAAARQDEALTLRAKGLSYLQIATVLGCSKDTAVGLVRRGNARRERHGLPKIDPTNQPTTPPDQPAA